MTIFQPLLYKPKPLYGGDIFLRMNPAHPLSSDAGKLKCMDQVLQAMRNTTFRPTDIMPDTPIDKAFSFLMRDLDVWSNTKENYPTIRILSTWEGKVAIVAYMETHKQYLSHIPMYFYPWLCKYNKELGGMWLGAVGALSACGVSGLDLLCEPAGHLYEQLLDTYDPRNMDDDPGPYDVAHASAKKEYGIGGSICKIAQSLHKVNPEEWVKDFQNYITSVNESKINAFERDMYVLLYEISKLVQSKKTLHDYSTDNRGEIQPGDYFQILWYQHPDVNGSYEQPDIMTRIHNEYLDSLYEGYGAAPMVQEKLISAKHPLVIEEDSFIRKMEEVFDNCLAFSQLYFEAQGMPNGLIFAKPTKLLAKIVANRKHKRKVKSRLINILK